MSFTPTGCFAMQIEYARNMLAACTAFQDWTGEADAASALERIYFGRLPDPRDGHSYKKGELTKRRPFAIVYYPEGSVFRRLATSTHSFGEQGRLAIRLEQEVPKSNYWGPTEEAWIEWHNWIGLIIGGNPSESTTGLCDLRVTGAAGHLFFDDVSATEPWCSNVKAQAAMGYFFACDLTLEF